MKEKKKKKNKWNSWATIKQLDLPVVSSKLKKKIFFWTTIFITTENSQNYEKFL